MQTSANDRPVWAPAERIKTTLEVVQWCAANADEIGAVAELVGRWVWIRFESKPSASVRAGLIAAGFRWTPSRSAWAHNCGVFTGKGKGDPRFKYGAVPVNALEPAGV